MYYVAPEKIRLKQLWSWGLFEKAQLVNDVCEQAVEEASLEGNIQKLERSWQSQLLQVTSHQDNKDVFILADDGKEIMSRLEEHQALLQTMSTSRFVCPSSPNASLTYQFTYVFVMVL
jgi:CCR4-NOT transcriptional regulation complex NOT5 subunit